MNNKELKKKMLKEQEEMNKKNRAIEQNIDLIKIIYQVYAGQVLKMDLRDVCITWGIYESEASFNYAIDRLIKDKVLRKEILQNTKNVVIVAKASVVKYLGGTHSIEFKDNIVRENCYKTKIYLKMKPGKSEKTVDDFIQFVNENTTFLIKNNDVESSYKFFEKHTNLSVIGEESRKIAIQKNLNGRKNVNKDIEVAKTESTMIAYDKSLASLKNMGLQFRYLPKKNLYSVYIIDSSENLKKGLISSKIATMLKIFYKQIEITNHTGILANIDIHILVRDSNRAYSLQKTIKDTIKDKKGSQMILNYLMNDINTKLQEGTDKPKISYTDSSIKNELLRLNNSYNGFNLKIQIDNLDISDRLDIKYRIAKSIESRINKKEQALKEKLRKEIEQELREKIMLELQTKGD